MTDETRTPSLPTDRASPAEKAADQRSFAALLSQLRKRSASEQPLPTTSITGLRILLEEANRPCDDIDLRLRVQALLGHYYADQQKSEQEWALSLDDWSAVLEGLPRYALDGACRAWLGGETCRKRPMRGDIRHLAQGIVSEASGLVEGAARPWMRERASEMRALTSDLRHEDRTALMAEGKAMGLSGYEAEIRAGWLRKHDARYAPKPATQEEREACARQVAEIFGLSGAALKRAVPEPDTPERRMVNLAEARREMASGAEG